MSFKDSSLHYDVIVIGGGGAGLSAALTAAGMGKKTLIVEQNRLGGECTWYGCIPSKALIALSRSTEATQNVMKKVDTVRQSVYAHETPEKLAERGVETIIGKAVFIGRCTLEVEGTRYTAKKIILATGRKPLIPPVKGLKDTPYLTNESLFELTRLPESLIIMGGGAIGVEMAQALCRLGVKITIVEMESRLLFREDVDAAQIVSDQLVEDGVVVHTATRIIEVGSEDQGRGVWAKISKNGQGENATLQAQSLLVSAGRTLDTSSLGLNAAGIKHSDRGIAINSKLRTSNRSVYVAGDVAGPYLFSHIAEYQGVLAALNALLPLKRKANYCHVAWVTFTDPELATAGLTEKEARDKYGGRVHVFTHRFEDTDRGRTQGVRGLVKIILDKHWKIVGAHIAGPRAGELICEVQVLKTLGIGFHKLASVIHPYPVHADILRQISKKVVLERIKWLLILSAYIKRLGKPKP